MEPGFAAGIDGGGTHTRLEIRSSDNQLLRREIFGPFNLNSIGETAFRSLLHQVFAACGDMANVKKLCIGAAGISNPDVEAILTEELNHAGFAGKWKLCGDQEIALRGALDGPGIVVIAGTGSICFGKNAAGHTARSGGFGHLIDDGGSGYALGRDALSEAVRWADGRGGDPAIQAAVFRALGISDVRQLVAFVYDRRTDKSAIARLSAVLLEEAAGGNGRALEILGKEAEELRCLAAAVQTRLNLPGCPIALLGGLLETANPYRAAAASCLSTLGPVTAPLHDPLWGAAQMAWEL